MAGEELHWGDEIHGLSSSAKFDFLDFFFFFLVLFPNIEFTTAE